MSFVQPSRITTHPSGRDQCALQAVRHQHYPLLGTRRYNPPANPTSSPATLSGTGPPRSLLLTLTTPIASIISCHPPPTTFPPNPASPNPRGTKTPSLHLPPAATATSSASIHFTSIRFASNFNKALFQTRCRSSVSKVLVGPKKRATRGEKIHGGVDLQ